jgi:hypothetical protein
MNEYAFHPEALQEYADAFNRDFNETCRRSQKNESSPKCSGADQDKTCPHNIFFYLFKVSLKSLFNYKTGTGLGHLLVDIREVGNADGQVLIFFHFPLDTCFIN